MSHWQSDTIKLPIMILDNRPFRRTLRLEFAQPLPILISRFPRNSNFPQARASSTWGDNSVQPLSFL
jgi:hypothetical protein